MSRFFVTYDTGGKRYYHRQGTNIITVDGDTLDYALPISGQTSGTPTNGTIVFSATEDLTVTASGDVTIVSTTRAADATFRRHDVVISCPNNGSGHVVIQGKEKIVSFGHHRGAFDPFVNFYTGTNATSPILRWNIDDIPKSTQKIYQITAYATILPANGSGSLPDNLVFLTWLGGNIQYNLIGGFNQKMDYLYITSANVVINTSSPLPPALRLIQFNGANINWTGTLFGSDSAPFPNMSSGFNLLDYRNPNSTVTASELITMLQNIMNRVGTMPATTRISEYNANPTVAAIQAASPVIDGTDAQKIKYWINQVLTKTTTFVLNGTNFT